MLQEDEVGPTTLNASLWTFGLARTVSIFGDRFSELALPILVLQETGSAFGAGIVAAASQLPTLIWALRAGRSMDDDSAPRIHLITADGTRFILIGALGLYLVLGGGISVLPLAILSFLIGLADVTGAIASSTVLPQIVPRSLLLKANSLLEAGDASASIVGPTLAGATIVLAGAEVALLVNAASFLLSALVLLRMTEQAGGGEAENVDTYQANETTSQFEGFRVIRRDRRLRSAVIGTATLNFHSGAIILLLVTLGQRRLDLSEGEIGFVVTGAGVGALIAATLISPRLSRIPWALALAVALLGAAVTTGTIGLANSLIILFLLTLLTDAAVSAGYVIAGTVRLACSPDGLLGRVNAAVLQIGAVARLSGALAAGALVEFVGPRAGFVPFVALLSVAFLVAARSSEDRTELNSLEPDGMSGI